MSERPMISIIVPVYNAEHTLRRCLDSIKEQIYTDFEVILIDDGSKDNSGIICDYYAKDDKRFKVIHTQNRGVSAARNTGLENICGKYVMFIDSDDYVHSDYLHTYIEYAEKRLKDVVLGGLIKKEKGFVIIKSFSLNGEKADEVWKDICFQPEMFGYIAGKMIRAEIIKENNIRLNEKMHSQEDLDFNLSVYEKCSKFEIIDYAGYEYEYVARKRKPPVWDFIANSLKMYRIASRKIELSNEAKGAIRNRIVSQIFAFLYISKDREEFEFAVDKLNDVEDLKKYLAMQEIAGESKYIIKWFMEEKYERIYRYFSFRKTIKKMMGRPISE